MLFWLMGVVVQGCVCVDVLCPGLVLSRSHRRQTALLGSSLLHDTSIIAAAAISWNEYNVLQFTRVQ